MRELVRRLRSSASAPGVYFRGLPHRVRTHDYTRVLRYSFRRRGILAAIVVTAILQGVLWAGSITSAYPVLKMVLAKPGEDWMQGIPNADNKTVQRAIALVQRVFPNRSENRDKFRSVVWIFSAVLVMTVVRGFLRYTQDFLVAKVGVRVARDVRNDLYNRVIRQDLAFFGEAGAAKMMTRFTVDVQHIDQGVRALYGQMIREPFKAIACFTGASVFFPNLAVLSLVAVPLVGGVIYRLGRVIKKQTRRVLGHTSFLNNILQETFLGIPIVKSFAMEDYEARRFAERNERLARNQVRTERSHAAADPATEILGMTAGVLVGILAAWQVVFHATDFAKFATFCALIVALYDPARRISGVNNRIQQCVAAARRVFEVADSQPQVAERPDAEVLPRMTAGIAFRDVHFRYLPDAPEALRGLDLEIKAGETVAIVGHSGAGKTTLVSLLPRFYDPTAGAVEIDGRDIRAVTFESLRRQIALVTQGVILFEDTVANNIAYGHHECPREEVVAAAKAANAHEFIEQLPQGYDTLLGERGESLSGGQRARLAIARAVLRDPAILVLDEATANLDSQSEALIQDALQRLEVGRTTIVIAHRLSTVQHAGRVVVLHEGRVESQGTHAQLLESSPIYKSLYALQFSLAAT